MAEVDVKKWVALGFDGFFDERHVSLLGGSAAFFNVAFCACAYDIFP